MFITLLWLLFCFVEEVCFGLSDSDGLCCEFECSWPASCWIRIKNRLLRQGEVVFGGEGEKQEWQDTGLLP